MSRGCREITSLGETVARGTLKRCGHMACGAPAKLTTFCHQRKEATDCVCFLHTPLLPQFLEPLRLPDAQTQALKSDCPGSASLFCSLAAWAGSVTSLSLRLLLRERARELYSLQRVVVKSGNSRNGPSLSAWYIASLSTWGLL